MRRLREWRRGRFGALIRRLPRLKHLRGTWLHRRLGDRLFREEMWKPRRERFAAGAALGIVVGMFPVPMQMLIAASCAFFLRVNIPAAIAGTWLSNPATFAVIVFGQYTLGSFLLGSVGKTPPTGDFMEMLAKSPLPILVGVIASAVLGALVSYPLALWAWDIFHWKWPGPEKKPPPPDGES